MGLGVEVDCIGALKPHPFEEALYTASSLVTLRFRRPPWLWKLQRRLNIGGEAALMRSMDIVYAWLHAVTYQSLDRSAERPVSPENGEDIKSVVELFTKSSSEDADGLRSDDLVDFLLTFIVMARDTTALALSWLFYTLGKHPDEMKELQNELMTRLPESVRNDKYDVFDDGAHQTLHVFGCGDQGSTALVSSRSEYAQTSRAGYCCLWRYPVAQRSAGGFADVCNGTEPRRMGSRRERV